LLAHTALSLCCFLHVSPRVQCWEFGSLPRPWKFSFFLHPCSLGGFSIPPPPPVSVLDYSLLFIFFSFAVGGSVCPGAVLDYFPGMGWVRGGWVRDPHVVCDDYLFLLQSHTGNFGASWWGEMVMLFLVWHGIGRLSTG
jgi:hypothetical protein